MTYRLLFHPDVRRDVVRMARFIAENAGEQAAVNAVDWAEQALAALTKLPNRGLARGDVVPGRIKTFRHSGVIPYLVDDERQEVFELGVFYGGQEWTRHVLARR